MLFDKFLESMEEWAKESDLQCWEISRSSASVNLTGETLILCQYHFLSLPLRTNLSVTIGSLLRRGVLNNIGWWYLEYWSYSWENHLKCVSCLYLSMVVVSVLKFYFMQIRANKDMCIGELTSRVLPGNRRVLCPLTREWTTGDWGQVYTFPNCTWTRGGGQVFGFLRISSHIK